MKYDYVLVYSKLSESGEYDCAYCESWVADATFFLEKDLERYKDTCVLMKNAPEKYRNVYLLKLS